MSIQSQNQDLHRMYAILSERGDEAFPENATEKHFEVPYLDHSGAKRTARGCLYLPDRDGPIPLVFFSYYKVTKDSSELVQYLKEGWAVASPFEDHDNNPEVTRDALVSNSALLYHLKHQKEIDGERIALAGGSAGGYMALMLSALHLFPCCTVAQGAFVNVFFNFRRYAPHLSGINLPVLLSLKAEGRADLMTMLKELPIPYGIVFNTFRTPEIDARLDDPSIAAAVSPLMLTDCFSNPMMEIHNTSDILCPVDQITRRYTYAHVSPDLPQDYKIRLSDYDMPEGFARSLADL